MRHLCTTTRTYWYGHVLLLTISIFATLSRCATHLETGIGMLTVGADTDLLPIQAWAAGNTTHVDNCIVPFFVDYVYHGCILDTFNAAYFTNKGAYSNDALRGMILSKLRNVGGVPNNISPHAFRIFLLYAGSRCTLESLH